MSAYRRLNRASHRSALQASVQHNDTTRSASNISFNDSNGNNHINRLNHFDDHADQKHAANSSDGTPKNQTNESSADNSSDLTMYTLQPKHIQFPDVPVNSELLNELMIFLYTLFAAGMQFLHLYRTVWWLPESNTSQSMNFYLIDEHLTIFIVILLGRRFVYCLLMRVLESLCSKQFHRIILKIARLAYFAGILSILLYLCYELFPKHEYNISYLWYPIIAYIVAFGFKIEPFFRTICETESSTYFNGIPTHSCSINPATIRTEIDVLGTDSSNRFKQVVFTAIMNAYYATFIPCCYAQTYLYYDLYWATQHLGFLVLGGFTMLSMFCFPANYCDVLHKASLHLGTWKRTSRVESRAMGNLPSANTWSKLNASAPGTFVRYSGELYKACGVITTAIPANGIHNRFYLFFQNPANIFLVLAIFQSVIIILQVIILFMVIEWHNIISLSYLILANYHTLFKIVRDFLVSQRMYAEESVYLEKTMHS